MPQMQIDQLMKRGMALASIFIVFAKLSRTDRLVCMEILYRNIGELNAFVVYTCGQYQSTGIQIDHKNLMSDLIQFQANALEMDESKF